MMRRLPLTLMLTLACGEDPSTGATAERAYTLCDGSSEVRLAAHSSGGELDQADPYVHPYGHSFLYVLGDCTYLAGTSRMGGFVEGTLSAKQASAIEANLRLSALWPAHEDESCPDAGRFLLATAQSYGWCSCGCDDDTPPALEASLDAAGMLLRELQTGGSKLSGPVEVGALVSEARADRTYEAWPIALDLASFAVPSESFYGWDEALPLRKVEGADADAVRQLRAEGPEPGLWSTTFVESDGVHYELYVLDAVPDRFATAIADFERTPRP